MPSNEITRVVTEDMIDGSIVDFFTGTYAQACFEKVLLARRDEHWRPVRFLQIGCYAGHATEWLARNFPDVAIHDVDTFGGEPGSKWYKGIDFSEVEKEYYERTQGLYTYFHRMTSDEFFCHVASVDAYFDFIYIDGDHRSDQVYRDAVHALAAVRPGGFIAFDDCGSHWPDVRRSIENVIALSGKKIELLDCGSHHQIWVRVG